MLAVKTFGGRLFSAVFGADVLACFRMSLEIASAQDAGLRIRLRLSEVQELADLPWEYLYNGPLNRFLSLSAETPVVRYIDLPERIQAVRVDLPLRVLVMVASPSDYPALDVEAEWTRLRRALADLETEGSVVVERLQSATLEALQRRLRRESCHVFHFIGHGSFSEQAGEGVLVLENKVGRADPVSSQYLGTLLHDHRPLRVAVLNACEGARGGRTDPFAGTAQSLVQQGIPAVIAMQFEITDEAAVIFAHELYLSIAEGCAIDTALAEGRKALFAGVNDVEWGTPVLYMRTSDGRIFDMASVRSRARSSGVASQHPTPLQNGGPAPANQTSGKLPLTGTGAAIPESRLQPPKESLAGVATQHPMPLQKDSPPSPNQTSGKLPLSGSRAAIPDPPSHPQPQENEVGRLGEASSVVRWRATMLWNKGPIGALVTVVIAVALLYSLYTVIENKRKEGQVAEGELVAKARADRDAANTATAAKAAAAIAAAEKAAADKAAADKAAADKVAANKVAADKAAADKAAANKVAADNAAADKAAANKVAADKAAADRAAVRKATQDLPSPNARPEQSELQTPKDAPRALKRFPVLKDGVSVTLLGCIEHNSADSKITSDGWDGDVVFITKRGPKVKNWTRFWHACQTGALCRVTGVIKLPRSTGPEFAGIDEFERVGQCP